MPSVTLQLYDRGTGTDRVAVEARGTQTAAGADVVLTAVVVTRPGPDVHEYKVLDTGGTPPTVPAGHVDESDGPTALRLRAATPARTVTALLVVPDPSVGHPPTSWPFFGRNFAAADAGGGIDLRLVLNLPDPAAGALAPPVAALTVRGQPEVAAGVFAAVSVGFAVLIDDLPVFPSADAPGLAVSLPEEFPWPEARVPWTDFPTLPGLAGAAPLRLPAYSTSLDPLPIRVGWDKAEISLTPAGVLRVQVRNLRVAGGSGELVGSPEFAFGPTGVTIPNAAPPLTGVTDLAFRTFDVGHFGFDARGTAAGSLLKLISDELGDATAAAGDLKLRVRTAAREIQEVRLDWGIGGPGRTLALPGFSAEFPSVDMFSLLFRRGDAVADGGPGPRVTLVATLAAAAAVEAHSTFCWPFDGGGRENLRDGLGTNSDEFVTLTATTKGPVSLVLCDLPVGGGGPARYLHRLRAPLAALQAEEFQAGGDDGTSFVSGLLAPEADEPLEVVPLSAADVDLHLATTEFVLPFLNIGTDQGITLKALTPVVDPTTLEIDCRIEVEVTFAAGRSITTQFAVRFVPQRMAFRVDHDLGFWLAAKPDEPPQPLTLLDLTWTFVPNPASVLIPGSVTPEHPDGVRVESALFVVTTKNGNYALRLAPGARIDIDYTRATTADEPIRFRVDEFAVGPKGVDLRAEVTDKPAKFNGLETQFRFSSGVLQVHENRVAGFTIAGTGPLPPALVGDATADVALQFAQQEPAAGAKAGPVRLTRGSAKIKGSNLLRCNASRFGFTLDGLGLEFVDDGVADHLYFTVTGTARYGPLPGDDPAGPLAWLPSIQLQLVDCPLTGNMRVIAQHVEFLVALPNKLTFNFLGCFAFEVRAIGFLPQFDAIRDGGEPTSAMQLSGQVLFADDGGDVLETKVDFHNLCVALPAPGSFTPRLHLKGLGIQIKKGSAFDLCGELEFFNNEPVDRNPNGTPILGDGFSGTGSLKMQDMFPMSATFAFLRVSPDGGATWRRAWFIYLEASKLSIQVPVVKMFLREIGLGFGYRYTLASLKAADESDDPRQLLRELQRLSRTQGNLSSRDQWRVDLERPGAPPPWTIALRAMMSEATAQKGPYGDYEKTQDKESVLPCLYLLDVVVALRSDLTFFMAGRAWLNTNYQDFLAAQAGRGSLPNNPAFSGFVVLSPRQKRLLANLASNPDAQFGNHPIVPGFLQEAFRNGRFTATLLLEPGLVHYELGWPNQLQWGGDLGPLQVKFRGGAIFRASTTEVVVGNSFLAEGTLKFDVPFDLGIIGGSVSATARVAFGARYVGVLAYQDPFSNSALYGPLGLEINVVLQVKFWFEIKVRLFRKTFRYRRDGHLALGVNFTAALEVGILFEPTQLATGLPAMRGAATVGIGVLGHDVHCNMQVEYQKDSLQRARAITDPFVNVGLEAETVEPVPGLDGRHQVPPPGGGGLAPVSLSADGSEWDDPIATAAETDDIQSDAQEVADAIAEGTRPPEQYSLTTIDVPRKVDGGQRRVYFLLVPTASLPGRPSRFFPVPPDSSALAITAAHPGDDPTVTDNITADLEWTFPAPATGVAFEHFDYTRNEQDFSTVTATDGAYAWKVDWTKVYEPQEAHDPHGNDPAPDKYFLLEYLLGAYLTADPDAGGSPDVQVGDPTPPSFDANNDREDERVRNPADAAFEAAVRGAFDQVAAPYLKFDEACEYDSLLRDACREDATIYSTTGTTAGMAPADLAAVQLKQQAIQMRGQVILQMLRDVQQYAELDGRGDADSLAAQAKLRGESPAFRMGMVFRAGGPAASVPAGQADKLHWLHAGTSTLRQRKDPGSTDPDSGDIPVKPFNTFEKSFREKPPSFSKVRTFEHANTVAITWQLGWGGAAGTNPEDDPEHHLSHYKVRRFHADGNDPTAEFTVKKGSVLHRRDATDESFVRMLARFQYVEHFGAEADRGGTPLTERGKTYVYTIVPVDLAGVESRRPLTVVVRRFPGDPPPVPADGELVVRYALADDGHPLPARLDTTPRIHDQVVPEDGVAVAFQWSDPPPAAGVVPPPVAARNLVFRREATLPVGFYGADQGTRGRPADGVPVTNARPLRTDIVVPLDGEPTPVKDADGNRVRAATGQPILQLTVEKSTLRDFGILPAAGGAWRPEAWRVFVQTVGPRRGADGVGVPSALASVAVRMTFVKLKGTEPQLDGPFEERRAGLLEWLPDPIRFDLLPPEDEAAVAGYAQVPMPQLVESDDGEPWRYKVSESMVGKKDVPGLRYEPHPERIRALKMTWNQGPSDSADHPLDLHARYQLFEFDANEHAGESLEFPEGKDVLPLEEWVAGAGLRTVQEVELLPAEDLPLVPADTSTPQAWDVWTPATSRRLLLRRRMIDDRTWPEKTDRTRLGPWYSWRDSYLNWPDPDPRPHDHRVALLDDATGDNFDGQSFPDATAAVPKLFTLKVGTAEAKIDLGTRTTVSALVDAVNTRRPAGPTAWAELVPATGTDLALRVVILPPVNEPVTRSVWPFHPLFRRLLYAIAVVREATGDSNGQPVYTVELCGGPVRGDHPAADAGGGQELSGEPAGGGRNVNPFPVAVLNADDDPTGWIGFLKDNSPEADPHAWGILQRMGLSVGFRVRRRRAGNYLLGPDLAELVRVHLEAVLKEHDYDEVKSLLPHLHVEFLFQPGARDELGADDRTPNKNLPGFPGLLAQARLSLRPTVSQLMEYREFRVAASAGGTIVAPGGTVFMLTVAAASEGVAFLIETGTPGDPIEVPAGESVAQPVVMPPSEDLRLIVRGKSPLAATVTAVVPTSPVPTSLPVSYAPVRPIDWPATFLTVPREAPWAKAAGGGTPATEAGWDRFKAYLRNVQAGLAGDVPANPADLRGRILGWLNRFFAEGGDVTAPGDTGAVPTGAALARTGAGPWVTAAYPRAATPLPLTPDAAGRITYFHRVEDQWGHIHRYYLRPQGRYDLIWTALSRSPRLFDHRRGAIDRLQREVAPPRPGGMDVVLERTRPLAAPLVLSSRRLDPPAAPGQAVPPGATWEVLVARHTEQELIDRNRALTHRLGFRQVAHALVRTFAHAGTVAALRPVVRAVVSGPFASNATRVGPTFQFMAGAVDDTFDLGAAGTLDDLAAKINSDHADLVTAAVVKTAVEPQALAVFRLVITPKDDHLLLPLKLLVVPATGTPTAFVSEPLDLEADRFEPAINAVAPRDPGDVGPPDPVPTLPVPPLPGPLAELDHLKLDALSSDEALSIDLPLRAERFTQGLMALQWQAQPYYYGHRLMLLAQASAVVSPITTVDQRDFEYVSPVLAAPPLVAVMEGVEAAGRRRRRIVLPLARLWDCLPPAGRLRWPVEDPDSVGNYDPESTNRRHSSVPDRDVVYQVLIRRPSGNVEVLAEYRFVEPAADAVVCYESRPIPGPFRGDVVRLLPPADGPGVGRQVILLETLLTRADGGEPDGTASEPVSGRAAFAGTDLVTFDPAAVRSCAVRLPDGPAPLPPEVVAAVLALAATADPSFATALRQAVAAPGPERYAEACIGLEQLTELNPAVVLDGAARTLTWPGPMTPAQRAVVEAWADVSLFGAALTALVAAEFEAEFPAGDANNPVQTDLVGVPATRLEVLADRLVLHDLLTAPGTADEVAAVTDLRAKPGLPAAVVAAADAVLAVLSDPAAVEAVLDLAAVEPSWRPRPTQATLPAVLADVLLVGHAVATRRDMMTRAEGEALRDLAGLTAPDRQAVVRLFADSITAGLGGGRLQVSTRRGSAAPAATDILASIQP